MKTLQIDENSARTLYPSASIEFRQMLNDSFGNAFFSEKITDRVKSYEDACRVLDIDQADIVSGDETPDEMAYKKLKIIVKALNEGWAPDWDNSNQGKYYPWFYQNKPGFRLLSVLYNYSLSDVGSRLCFKTRELAEYATAQFLSIYKDYFTI